jgi:hypothetical protein
MIMFVVPYSVVLISLLVAAYFWRQSSGLRDSLRESCEMFVKKKQKAYPDGFFKVWPPGDDDFACDVCRTQIGKTLRPQYLACQQAVCEHCFLPHLRNCPTCQAEEVSDPLDRICEISGDGKPFSATEQQSMIAYTLGQIATSTCERCKLDFSTPKRWEAMRNCHSCGHICHSQCMAVHQVNEDLSHVYECYRCHRLKQNVSIDFSAECGAGSSAECGAGEPSSTRPALPSPQARGTDNEPATKRRRCH